ncbi:MAG: inorganic diphosphatase [Acidobacteria bacterium]|nr:inorganic diphosphatase [Acidobacteriota bacterium]
MSKSKKNDSVTVIIETPKGSRNKYAFEEEQRAFVLKKVLPAGMVFPYDFGFVPGTKGGDGDPLDVLVLMDEPAFPGCHLPVRIVGVIEAEQIEGRKRQRNDRVLAIAEVNHAYAGVTDIRELPEQLLAELEGFFVNYSELEGRRFRVLARHGAARAQALLEKARSAV